MLKSSIEKHVASLVRNAVQNVLNGRELEFPIKERQKLIVANWKMNMTYSEAYNYFGNMHIEDKNEADIVFCPPYTLLYPMKHLFREGKQLFLLGAQNVHWENEGAYTGEISAEMLNEVGCQFVIIGHSERRAAGETDKGINLKVKHALANRLKPIICVGETFEQKEKGLTLEVVSHQLLQALNNIKDISNIIIAYEPIWAIGTGVSASPEQAQAVHEMIRQILFNGFGQVSNTISILYGGSVKPENSRSLSMMRDIDGLLVGGASLIVEDFTEIVKSFS